MKSIHTMTITTEAGALENLLRDGCPFHPKYKAKRKATKCKLCKKLYRFKNEEEKELRKALPGISITKYGQDGKFIYGFKNKKHMSVQFPVGKLSFHELVHEVKLILTI